MEVKIKLLNRFAKLPEYKTDGSAAMDLSYASETPLTVCPGERILVPTGIAISIPSSGYAALVCARSGLSSKYGITLSNGIGVIDSDYRGEIKVAVINLGSSDYTIEPGERIAQLMFVPVERAAISVTDSLDETQRGAGGFGSTGKD
ncbi:MAG: dUTP diphosphatase [Clostridia bacterium]|nr:dUTP diphosphatase [Clostridia bacterium]